MIIDVLRNVARSRRVEQPFRGKLQVLNTLNRITLQKKLRSGNGQVQIKFNDFTVFGYDFITLDLLYREIFMSEQYKFESETDAPVIIDCGSNIGVSVLYFKNLYPKSKVLAYEANPYTFALLEKNMMVNKIEGVESYNNALWDEDMMIPFFISDNVGTLLGSVRQDRGGDREIQVQSKKLSEVVRQYDTIELIKIDVEGAEKNIIQDLNKNNLIEKSKKYVVEYHHNIKGDPSTLSAFLQIFESKGYDYIIKESYTDPYYFQDLLIYFYKRGSLNLFEQS